MSRRADLNVRAHERTSHQERAMGEPPVVLGLIVQQYLDNLGIRRPDHVDRIDEARVKTVDDNLVLAET